MRAEILKAACTEQRPLDDDDDDGGDDDDDDDDEQLLVRNMSRII
jgi:hypothetical protein